MKMNLWDPRPDQSHCQCDVSKGSAVTVGANTITYQNSLLNLKSKHTLAALKTVYYGNITAGRNYSQVKNMTSYVIVFVQSRKKNIL